MVISNLSTLKKKNRVKRLKAAEEDDFEKWLEPALFDGCMFEEHRA